MVGTVWKPRNREVRRFVKVIRAGTKTATVIRCTLGGTPYDTPNDRDVVPIIERDGVPALVGYVRVEDMT